jgi:hypothetical protein
MPTNLTEPAGSVIAIDIALEPDAVMMRRAETANAALRQNFPQGFALDDTHHAHITVLQCFVLADALEPVYAAVAGVLGRHAYSGWRLTAFKYYYVPTGPIGVAGIVVEPIADLLSLQEEVVAAVAPYTVHDATEAACYTTPAEPDIHPSLIPYVASFVPQQTGQNYNPHVSTGVGSTAFLDKLLARPFDAFDFYLSGASIYQLGNFGTARKELKALPANR